MEDTFHLSAPRAASPGESFSLTVTAVGPAGTTNTQYLGRVHFTSTDPMAVLPPDYTFVPGDAGSHTFTLTLATIGSQSVTVTEMAGVVPAQSINMSILPDTLALAASVTKANPGTPFNLTVTAYDPNGLVDAGYHGTIHFTCSDLMAVLPANYTFQASDRGQHTFRVTLFTGGRPTITVSDTAGVITPAQLTVPVESGPQLTALPDQTMLLSAGSLVLTVPTPTDADGDSVTLAQPVISGFSPAYDLRTRLSLYEYVGRTGPTFFQNSFGQNEKWLFSAVDGNRYLILPTGEVRQYLPGRTHGFAQTTLVATFDPGYWRDPTLLTAAAQPPAPAVSATLDPATDQLTITPPAHYIGTFRVTLTASDGSLTTSQSFLVTVTDSRPSLLPVADQTLLHTQASLQLTLNATDADAGDTVTFPAPVFQGYSPTFNLQQRLALYEYVTATGPSYFQSAAWGNGKWLFSALDGARYLLLPSGQVLQYVAGASTIAGLLPVAALDPAVWVNPTLLTSASAPSAPAGVTASIAGSVLTVTVPSDYIGTFQVSVTATDGTLSTAQSFLVHVVDHRPTLQSVPDQTVAPNSGPVQVTLTASDPDAGDSVSFLAPTVTGSSPAYDLQQLLGLYEYKGPAGASYFQSPSWQNGKWLFSSLTGNRYLLLPSGQLLQYVSGATSVSGLRAVARLDSSIYTNPSQLLAAPLPPALTGVTASVNGNVLSVTVPTGYTGTFRVTVAATDGAETAEQSFLLNVTSRAADDTPVLAALPDMILARTQNPLPAIPLSLHDNEQTPTVIQALTARPGPTYDLQQQLGLYAYQGTSGPNYFQSAAWGNGKWLFSALNGGRYLILASGEVKLYVTDATNVAQLTHVTQLDPSVYLDPRLLTGPAALPIGTTISNTALTLSPAATVAGSFWTKVLATDGVHLTQQRFLTTLTNSAPLVGLANGTNPPLALPDVVLVQGSGPQTVNLSTADSNGDAITLHAGIEAAGPAADLQRQLGLYEYMTPTGRSYFQSAAWDNGKWLFSAVNGGRYLILPDGSVKQWTPGDTTVAQLTSITTLDPSVYADPTLLTDPLAPAASVNLAGSTLTITTPDDYTGSFWVSVTASDGLQTTLQSFLVTVTKTAP